MAGKRWRRWVNIFPPYLNLAPELSNVPIINTNPWTFAADLENLIKILPYIKKYYASKGREFARKHHDAKKIALEYLKIYESV